MKDWKLTWHKASEELPEESGGYLVIIESDLHKNGIVSLLTVEYSEKHKAFNAHDHEAVPAHPMTVDYWAEYPKTIEE